MRQREKKGNKEKDKKEGQKKEEHQDTSPGSS